MSLELDTRQRAMLQEMGIHVWQTTPAPRPESAVAWVACFRLPDLSLIRDTGASTAAAAGAPKPTGR